MRVKVHNETEVYGSFRANRTRSLFNVEDERGAIFELDAELPGPGSGGGVSGCGDWNIGLVVGPSGSGKSSIGRELVRAGAKWWDPRWPKDRPIVDAVGRGEEYDVVTGAFAAVGLGDVPAWLRPHSVLSMGEQFRANLARLCVEGGDDTTWVVDEFTSVVDRQIARIGSMAFAKTFRRTGGQAVLLSCHHDIVEWLVPDWCYDTGTGEMAYPKAQGSQDPQSSSTSSKSAGRTGTSSSRITI